MKKSIPHIPRKNDALNADWC